MNFKFKLHPITERKLKRFRSIKRGYYSLIILSAMIILTLLAELMINNRALVVKYEGEYFFPTYGEAILGKTFGFEGFGADSETDYKALKEKFEKEKSGNFVIMPLVPYDPYEIDSRFVDSTTSTGAAQPPSFSSGHVLGTDAYGRDLLARITYGFRMTIWFSLGVVIAEYLIGIFIGCSMGYIGGWFDSIAQRLCEILSTTPFLFVVIIIAALMRPNIFLLAGIFVFFGWIGMSYLMRMLTYKEKAADYVMAVRSLGASHSRTIFRHILPNTTSVLVSRLPFSLISGITALTALDFIGFGLPAPTPSWGELLAQGKANMVEFPWILASIVVTLAVALILTTFVGEAVREATDPKAHSVYE